MPKSEILGSEVIRINGVPFSKDLFFYDSSRKSKSISPKARFDPVGALSGQEWQASTSPSQEPQKKKLIIDVTTFYSLTPGVAIPLISKLKSCGFEVFLLTKQNGKKFVRVEDDLKNLTKNLFSGLEKFDPKTDYALAGQMGIARDMSVLFDYKMVVETTKLLTERTGGSGGIFFNHFWSQSRILTENELKNFQIKTTNCMISVLQNLRTNKPKFVEALIEEYSGKIMNGWELSYCIKAVPQLAERLIKEHSGKIMNGLELSCCIEAAPQLAEKLIKEHSGKITNGWELSCCIEAAPQLAERLIKEHSGKITNGWELSCCIEAVPQLAERLIKEHSGKIMNGLELSYCIKAAPQLAERLIKEHSGKIMNGFGLSFCIKAAPQLAGRLIKEHSDKIKNCNDLADYIKEAQRLIEELIEEHSSKIKNCNDLADYIKEAPQLAEKLIKKHSGKITNGWELSACIKAAPQLAERLIKEHSGKITNGWELSACIKAEPRLFEDFIEGNRVPLAEISYDEQSSQKKPAHLFIADASGEKLEELLKENLWSEVATVKFLRGKDFDANTCRELFKKMPKLCHVIVSSALEATISGILPPWVSYSKEDPISIDAIAIMQMQKQEQQTFSASVAFSSQSTARGGVIKLAQSELGSKSQLFPTGSSSATHCKSNAGEALNVSACGLQVRTRVIERNISLGEGQCEYTPTADKLRSVENVGNITDDDINAFKLADAATNGGYYLFSLQMKSGKKYRLPSVSFAETLVGIKTQPDGVSAEVKRGDDDFFYVTSSQDCDLSYVVNVGCDAEKSLEQMRGGDADSEKIKRIIGDFKDPSKDYKPSSSYHFEFDETNKNLTREQKLERLFEVRKGSCEQRVAAVEFALRQGKVAAENVRVVDINNNHVILEVRENGQWFKADLGGSSNCKTIRTNTAYSAQEVRQHESHPNNTSSSTVVSAQGQQKTPLDNASSPETAIAETAQTPQQSNVATASLAATDTIKTSQTSQQQVVTVSQPSTTIDVTSALTAMEQSTNSTIAAKFADTLYATMEQFIRSMIEPQRVISSPEEVFDTDAKNTLLVCSPSRGDESDNLNHNANLLLQSARNSSRKTFYIDSPEKARVASDSISIGANGKVAIKAGSSPLSEFLNEVSKRPQDNAVSPPILMINWGAFDARQKVALNSVINQVRSIGGREIPDHFHVVSLCSELPRDISFLSRHQAFVRSNATPSTLLSPKEAGEAIEIDLEGHPNWRANLFGFLSLRGKEINWSKSDFTKFLQQRPDGVRQHFVFKNISVSDFKKLEYELKQAAACGYCDYHGCRIPFFDSITFARSEMEFEFDKLQLGDVVSEIKSDVNPRDLKIRSEFRRDEVSDRGVFEHAANVAGSGVGAVRQLSKRADSGVGSGINAVKRLKNHEQISSVHEAALVNTYLFDSLLNTSIIADGHYTEQPGLIEQESLTLEKQLSIFITSNLSRNQWYCLFNHAQKHQIKLKIHLANGVELPDELRSKFSIPVKTVSTATAAASAETAATSTSTTAFAPTPPRIFVNNNTDEVGKALKGAHVIDVEDYGYGDLVERISCEKSERGFEKFKEIESDVLGKLQSGDKVILKGKFDPELLKMLHPMMIDEKLQNLIFVLEDENITPNQTEYDQLKFLGKGAYGVRYLAVRKQQRHDDPPEDNSAFKYDPLDLPEAVKSKSDEFLLHRIHLVKEELENNSIISLVGHSGVGKSSLMKEFEKKGAKVHNELGSFETWAQEGGILFIDESNIEDMHLTMFNQLKNGGNKEVFYSGKLHQLNDTHKVVFAGNDRSYGGGRVEQKLFADNSIPEIRLSDFPNSYIYEEILKKAIFDLFPQEQKSALFSVDESEQEAEFLKLCSPLIEAYQQHNARHTDISEALTVRELQEQVLQALVEREMIEKDLEILPKIESKNFISTSVTKEAELALRQCIRIRARQRDGALSPVAAGTNGVLLQGDSGIGKSEMVNAVLKSEGYEIVGRKDDLSSSSSQSSVDEQIAQTAKKKCYRIGADMPFDEKKRIIKQAFNEGNAVWIDEINSCIDDGLEKVLNAVLAGVDPDTKQHAAKPGFFLLATANGIPMEGRSRISPALMHRLAHPKLTPVKDYSPDDLEAIVKHHAKQQRVDGLDDLVHETVQCFKGLSGEYTQCQNLRVLSDLTQKIINSRELGVVAVGRCAESCVR